MERLYVATTNAHKVAEFERLLSGAPFQVHPLPSGLPACPENGQSFEANAVEKAVHYARWCDGWLLADDSGLAVDALDGAPGVHSARYAGEPADDKANNDKLLTALANVPEAERTAEFVCVLALWSPVKRLGTLVRGSVTGVIVHTPRGDHGFGYDPLFWLPDLNRTMAELTTAEKNQVSHRQAAVARLKQNLPVVLRRE